MTDQAGDGGAPPFSPPSPPIGRGYRAYVMGVLVLMYTCNFVDRSLLGVLGQAIKADLTLQDWQLGVLAGPAFALLYSLGGLPVARLAERSGRVGIISAAIAVWSTMTALCGAAAGFWTLALARVGVGLGEAGYVPAAYSLVADYYPPSRRASALGVFTLGVPFGALFGAVLGGALAQGIGWRSAFLVLGLPGLLLALLFRLTVREPARGGLDPAFSSGEATPSLGAVLRHVLRKPAFVHLTVGASLTSFAGYAVVQFAIPFLLRGYGVDLKTASTLYGLVGALAAAVGIAAGGYLADAAGVRDPRLRAVVPGLALMLAAPLYIAAFQQPTLLGLGAMVIAPAILQYLYMGPVFALAQNMVGARMRATTTAIVNITLTVIGLGLGPPLIGALSDFLAARAYNGLMPFVRACPGGVAPAGATGFAADSCRLASFHGLQEALMVAAAIYLWAGFHFLLAARTLRRDLES
ncbi:MAG TPA: MFS transporter [Caulobacteraceae bacterium]|jgi:predicted MFS family arabinose efflux permease|nr:MFS transporter [Caulobacteraceae bacterium]